MNICLEDWHLFSTLGTFQAFFFIPVGDWQKQTSTVCNYITATRNQQHAYTTIICSDYMFINSFLVTELYVLTLQVSFNRSTYWDILWVPVSGPGSPFSLSSGGRLLGNRAEGWGCCLQLLLIKQREAMTGKNRLLLLDHLQTSLCTVWSRTCRTFLIFLKWDQEHKEYHSSFIQKDMFASDTSHRSHSMVTW